MLKSTQQQPSVRTVGKLYQMQEGASAADIRDQLNARLGQLFAMLSITYGAGQETFENWSDEIKDNYMWCATMIAEECQALALHI